MPSVADNFPEFNPQSTGSVFKIVLSQKQAAQFEQALSEAKELTGVSGVFATLRRCFSSASGEFGLELQIAKLDREATRKIQRILASAFQNAEQDGSEVRL